MRCPPGLVFDDVYQRCEWPGAGAPIVNQRLGSLRDKKADGANRTNARMGKLKIKPVRLMSSMRTTVSSPAAPHVHSSSPSAPTKQFSTTTATTTAKNMSKIIES